MNMPFLVATTPPDILALMLHGLNTEVYSTSSDASYLVNSIVIFLLLKESPKKNRGTVRSLSEAPAVLVKHYPYLF